MAKEAIKEEEQEVVIPSREELLGVVSGEVDEDTGSDEGDSNYSELEQSAIDKGWNPEGVEGKRNLNAEEFLDRQSLYDDIHSLKRQNKRLLSDIENINKYQSTIREDERKRVLEALKFQKKEALDMGDHGKVIEIDEQIAEERDKSKSEQAEAKTNEDFNEWVVDNAWYTEDNELREEADVYGETYWRRNPTKSRNEVYSAVTNYIKRSYKDKFENSNRGKPSPVEPGTSSPRRQKAKSKVSSADLPADQRSIMKTILRTTGMTEEQYLKDYFAMNGEG